MKKREVRADPTEGKYKDSQEREGFIYLAIAILILLGLAYFF